MAKLRTHLDCGVKYFDRDVLTGCSRENDALEAIELVWEGLS